MMKDSIKFAEDEISEEEIKDQIFKTSMSYLISEKEVDKIYIKPKYWHCNKCNCNYAIQYKSKHLETRKHQNNIA